ncbi:MAG TPA: transglutaminase family protein [Reyranella sp.]|jgi:transglutaminase-like putative cysteine protease|nr:transglutaminase family protein [Reyranella sp.]
MRLSIQHRTRYRYEGPVAYSAQVLRLTPAQFASQKTVNWKVECAPAATLREGRDGFGNVTHFLAVNRPHDEIEILAAGIVETTDAAGVVSGIADPVPHAVYLRHTPLAEPAPAIAALVETTPGADRIAWLHALMNIIREKVAYVAGVTHAMTTAAQALNAGHGVCQDHAHIFITAARLAGIPSRYVTGYLLIDEAAQAVAHHAWGEAWVPGLGWLAFDPANGICPTDRYVRLAVALDARYAAPIRGTHLGGVGEELAVEVRVQQVAPQQ